MVVVMMMVIGRGQGIVVGSLRYQLSYLKTDLDEGNIQRK